MLVTGFKATFDVPSNSQNLDSTERNQVLTTEQILHPHQHLDSKSNPVNRKWKSLVWGTLWGALKKSENDRLPGFLKTGIGFNDDSENTYRQDATENTSLFLKIKTMPLF